MMPRQMTSIGICRILLMCLLLIWIIFIFIYHTHVWQSFFANSVKVWGANFFELNDRALSAALFGAGPKGRPNRANMCEHCGTYTHNTEHCPFEAREIGSKLQSRTSCMSDESRVCRWFQRRFGCKSKKCTYRHVCENCGSPHHGEIDCNAGQW